MNNLVTVDTVISHVNRKIAKINKVKIPSAQDLAVMNELLVVRSMLHQTKRQVGLEYVITSNIMEIEEAIKKDCKLEVKIGLGDWNKVSPSFFEQENQINIARLVTQGRIRIEK